MGLGQHVKGFQCEERGDGLVHVFATMTPGDVLGKFQSRAQAVAFVHEFVAKRDLEARVREASKLAADDAAKALALDDARKRDLETRVRAARTLVADDAARVLALDEARKLVAEADRE